MGILIQRDASKLKNSAESTEGRPFFLKLLFFMNMLGNQNKNLVENKLTFGQNLTLDLLNIMALSNKTMYSCSTV